MASLCLLGSEPRCPDALKWGFFLFSERKRWVMGRGLKKVDAVARHTQKGAQ